MKQVLEVLKSIMQLPIGFLKKIANSAHGDQGFITAICGRKHFDRIDHLITLKNFPRETWELREKKKTYRLFPFDKYIAPAIEQMKQSHCRFSSLRELAMFAVDNPKIHETYAVLAPGSLLCLPNGERFVPVCTQLFKGTRYLELFIFDRKEWRKPENSISYAILGAKED